MHKKLQPFNKVKILTNMELSNSIQTSSEYLQSQPFDAIISVSSYETRSTYLIEKFDVSKIPIRIALTYTEQMDCLGRIANDQKYLQKGFTLQNTSLSNSLEINRILDNIIGTTNNKKDLNILVDYSSMSKIWYNAIINYLQCFEEDLNNVTIWFSYAPSEYRKSQDLQQRDLKNNLPKLSGKKPLSVLIGLGCDKDSSTVFNAIKSEQCFAFLPSQVIDERYKHDVETTNKTTLSKISPNHLIEYPLLNLNEMYSAINSVCFDMRMTHETLLVPAGPKPFSLMCSIVSARYPDVKLWNIPSNYTSKVVDRIPNGEILLYKVVFTSEEVDY